jgi:hypothetical protein
LLASAQPDLPALREGLLAWWAIHGRHSIPWKLGADQQPVACGTALDPYSIWVLKRLVLLAWLRLMVTISCWQKAVTISICVPRRVRRRWLFSRQ